MSVVRDAIDDLGEVLCLPPPSPMAPSICLSDPAIDFIDDQEISLLPNPHFMASNALAHAEEEDIPGAVEDTSQAVSLSQHSGDDATGSVTLQRHPTAALDAEGMSSFFRHVRKRRKNLEGASPAKKIVSPSTTLAINHSFSSSGSSRVASTSSVIDGCNDVVVCQPASCSSDRDMTDKLEERAYEVKARRDRGAYQFAIDGYYRVPLCQSLNPRLDMRVAHEVTVLSMFGSAEPDPARYLGRGLDSFARIFRPAVASCKSHPKPRTDLDIIPEMMSTQPDPPRQPRTITQQNEEAYLGMCYMSDIPPDHSLFELTVRDFLKLPSEREKEDAVNQMRSWGQHDLADEMSKLLGRNIEKRKERERLAKDHYELEGEWYLKSARERALESAVREVTAHYNAMDAWRIAREEQLARAEQQIREFEHLAAQSRSKLPAGMPPEVATQKQRRLSSASEARQSSKTINLKIKPHITQKKGIPVFFKDGTKQEYKDLQKSFVLKEVSISPSAAIGGVPTFSIQGKAVLRTGDDLAKTDPSGRKDSASMDGASRGGEEADTNDNDGEDEIDIETYLSDDSDTETESSYHSDEGSDDSDGPPLSPSGSVMRRVSSGKLDTIPEDGVSLSVDTDRLRSMQTSRQSSSSFSRGRSPPRIITSPTPSFSTTGSERRRRSQIAFQLDGAANG